MLAAVPADAKQKIGQGDKLPFGAYFVGRLYLAVL